MNQQPNELTEADSAAETSAPETPSWDPGTWDWTSNEAPPVPYWAPDEVFPTTPWAGTGDFPGHWEWVAVFDDAGEPVGRWPGWFFDELPSETDIKAEIARQMLAASQTAQAALVATLGPLRDAVAKLDPEVIRQPDGFEILGFAVDRETEMNQVRMAMGDIAEAVKAASEALEANVTANSLSVDAVAAVLEAVPSTVAVAALSASPPADAP